MFPTTFEKLSKKLSSHFMIVPELNQYLKRIESIVNMKRDRSRSLFLESCAHNFSLMNLLLFPLMLSMIFYCFYAFKGYHVCNDGREGPQGSKFLCTNGTIFRFDIADEVTLNNINKLNF